MKKIYAVLLCAIMVKVLAGCEYCYINPNERPNEIWIANDICLYMQWDEDAGTVLGEAIVDDQHIDLEVWWTAANEVHICPYPYPEGVLMPKSFLLSGIIEKNGKDKYTLSISKEEQQYNKLFPGYSTIPITTYDISEVEWVDGWPVPIEE